MCERARASFIEIEKVEGGRESWIEAGRVTFGSHIPRPQSPTFLTGELDRDFDFLVCIFGGEDEYTCS